MFVAVDEDTTLAAGVRRFHVLWTVKWCTPVLTGKMRATFDKAAAAALDTAAEKNLGTGTVSVVEFGPGHVLAVFDIGALDSAGALITRVRRATSSAIRAEFADQLRAVPTLWTRRVLIADTELTDAAKEAYLAAQTVPYARNGRYDPTADEIADILNGLEQR